MERLPGCQPNKAICHGCRPNASHTLTHNLASEIVGLRPPRLLSLPPFPPGPSSPPSVFPFSIAAPCFLFPRSPSSSRLENSLRFWFIRRSFVIPKNALLTGFLISYIESYDYSFSNRRTVSKNLSLRLTFLQSFHIYELRF